MTTRAKITAIDTHIVELTAPDFLGTIHTTQYRAPISGGYVRDETGSQVCDGLCGRGPTLEWSGKYPLIDLIRREWRRTMREMRAEERSICRR